MPKTNIERPSHIANISVEAPAVAALPESLVPFSFDLKRASGYTGISSWALRSAIWGGQLRAHQCNKKYIITKSDLESFVTNLDEVRSLKCVNTTSRKRLSRRAASVS